MSFNLLITSTGGVWASNLIIQIRIMTKHHPIKIHTADILKDVKSKYVADSFNTLPKASNKNYIKEIIKIVKKKSIDLIIPGSDEEAIKLSKEKQKILKFKAQVSCVDYKFLRNFQNKLNTYKKLDELKIRGPVWKEANNLNELIFFVNSFLKSGHDVVVKPVFSRGGRNVSIIRKNIRKIKKENFGREIHMTKEYFFKKIYKKYSNLFPLIVMERLYEPTYDFDILAWKGKLLKTVFRKRIGAQGINGHIVEFNKKKFLNYAKEIAKGFNLSWLYDLDVMFNKNLEPVLIELNPRISGSIHTGMIAGVPLIDDQAYA